MNPLMVQIAMIVGVLIMLYAGFLFYREFKKSEAGEKKKLIKVYAVVGVLSVVLFVGIRMAELPQKLWPQYYEPTMDSLDDFVDEQNTLKGLIGEND
jgi:Ni/Fe-hydrogenase subunit HybB-like protein